MKPSMRPMRPMRYMRPNTVQLRKKKNIEKMNNTQLYIFKLYHGIYKIGCSDDVNRRFQEGKTWSSEIEIIASRKIPALKSSNWRHYEHKIHKEFSGNRCVGGGTELFRFAPREVHKAKNFMKNMRF